METPLIVAAKRGVTASVRWLLQRDAKMDVLDRAVRASLLIPAISVVFVVVVVVPIFTIVANLQLWLPRTHQDHSDDESCNLTVLYARVQVAQWLVIQSFA